MEPITHLMTGAVLARTGFNRRAAYATITMTLAAEMPDIDTLWSIRGPVENFIHHRGITHTFAGIPFEAAALTLVVFAFHKLTGRKPRRGFEAPVNWPLLWMFAVLALLSHIFLDWTNNYGVRPFLPWNPTWYGGDFVFIFEPVIFVLLAGALALPSLLSLINSEVSSNSAIEARKPRGRLLAIAALVLISALWSWRYAEHAHAVAIAQAADYGAADPTTGVQQIRRISLSPYPIDPFHWHAVVELPDAYQLAEIDARKGTITSTGDPATDPNFNGDLRDRIAKPDVTLATLAAGHIPFAEAYRGWSVAPLVRELPPELNNPETTVRYSDLRYAYDTSFMKGREHPPLSFDVTVDANRHVVDVAPAK